MTGRPPDPRNLALYTLKSLSERVAEVPPEHVKDVVDAHNALYKMIATEQLEKEALSRISMVETSVKKLNNIEALNSQNIAAKGLPDVMGALSGGNLFNQRGK